MGNLDSTFKVDYKNIKDCDKVEPIVNALLDKVKDNDVAKFVDIEKNSPGSTID